MTTKREQTPEQSNPETRPPLDQNGSRSPELERLRVTIGKLSVWAFGTLFVLTVLAAVFLYLIIGTQQVTNVAIEKMALAASVQVVFGMIIGYASLWIGLMMT